MRFSTASIFVMIFLAAALLAGCTFNPQDIAPPQKAGGQNAGLGDPAGNGTAITLTMEEVAKHNTASDCWMVINERVLDLTGFANHPGGSVYVPYCGTNGTAAYYNIPGTGGRSHSATADSWLQAYTVGTLGQQVGAAAIANVTNNSNIPSGPGGFGGDD